MAFCQTSSTPIGANSPALQAVQPRIVLTTGAVLGLLSLLVPSGIHYRPNRIFVGENVALITALGWAGFALVGLWVVCAAFGFFTTRKTQGRALTLAVMLGIMPTALLLAINQEAFRYAQTNGEIGRVSLGGGVWMSFLATYISLYAVSALVSSKAGRFTLYIVPLIGIVIAAGFGLLDSLSILREYALNNVELNRQLQVHLGYTLGATLIGCLIGISAGVLARTFPALESPLFGVLNVFNVIPVLAFIGILNPILTAMRDKVGILSVLGVQAVGWLPVIIVLSLYASYPIARNTHSALVALEESVVDAAKGMGMGLWRRLVEVEIPLASPVIIAGIRIALVQSTAGAIIAGLVGGGGLGTFVFMGASQTATDLVLLGTIPIVGIGLLFDRIAWATQDFFARKKIGS